MHIIPQQSFHLRVQVVPSDDNMLDLDFIRNDVAFNRSRLPLVLGPPSLASILCHLKFLVLWAQPRRDSSFICPSETHR